MFFLNKNRNNSFLKIIEEQDRPKFLEMRKRYIEYKFMDIPLTKQEFKVETPLESILFIDRPLLDLLKYQYNVAETPLEQSYKITRYYHVKKLKVYYKKKQ
jgi:hypothetical protein